MKTGRAINDHDTDETAGTEREEQTLVWMKDWVEPHGCKQSDSNLVYTGDVPMNDMWREYEAEIDKIIEPLGERQFRRVWNRHMGTFCHKRRRKPFGTCADCTGYKARIHRNARDPTELLLVKEKYYDHLNMQKLERQIYYKHRMKGLRGDAVSVIMDGMDQSKLIMPHTKVKPKDVANFLETKITGVLVHGKRFDAYISEPQVASDSNLNLTCLHSTLMKLRRDAPGGVLPRKLYLQVDGGTKNKNKWMISYLKFLC